MTKRKRTDEQTMICNTLHGKIDQYEPHQNRRYNQMLRTHKQFLLHLCAHDELLLLQTRKSQWRPQNFRSDDFNLSNGNNFSGTSWLAATVHKGNHGRIHLLWNIVSIQRYILHIQVLLQWCYILMEFSQLES